MSGKLNLKVIPRLIYLKHNKNHLGFLQGGFCINREIILPKEQYPSQPWLNEI